MNKTAVPENRRLAQGCRYDDDPTRATDIRPVPTRGAILAPARAPGQQHPGQPGRRLRALESLGRGGERPGGLDLAVLVPRGAGVGLEVEAVLDVQARDLAE